MCSRKRYKWALCVRRELMILYSNVVDTSSLQCVSVERVLHITVIALNDEAVYEHVVALCRCEARRSRNPNFFFYFFLCSNPGQDNAPGFTPG